MTLEQLRDECIRVIDAQATSGRPARVYLTFPAGERPLGGRGVLRQLMCVNPAGERVYTYSADVVLTLTRRAILVRDSLQDEEPQAERASHLIVCAKCGLTYGRHPLEQMYKSCFGEPYLHRLCDGRLVKL